MGSNLKVVKRNIFGWKTVVNYNEDALKEQDELIEFLTLALKTSEPELRQEITELKHQINQLIYAFGGEEFLKSLGHDYHIREDKSLCCQNQSA